MTGARTLLATITFALYAAMLVYHFTSRTSTTALNTQSNKFLILAARAVETEVARFGTLPAIAAQDACILAAINAPDIAGNIDAAIR